MYGNAYATAAIRTLLQASEAYGSHACMGPNQFNTSGRCSLIACYPWPTLHQKALVGTDGYPTLRADLQSNIADKQQQAATRAWQYWVSGSQQDPTAIIAAGVVPLLVALLRSDHAHVQKEAARALGTLADGSEQSEDAIISAGGVPLLVALFRSDQPSVPEEAARTLKLLANGSQHSKDAITAVGPGDLPAGCFSVATCATLSRAEPKKLAPDL